MIDVLIKLDHEVLVEKSKRLNVSFSDAKKMLREWIKEVKEIKALQFSVCRGLTQICANIYKF